MSRSMARSCWIATDGAVGNEKQCQALAHYLGLQPEVFRITLRQPWEALAPHLRAAGRLAIQGSMRARLGGPLPDLLIAAGRRSALAALTVKRLSGGRTFITQVLNPHIAPARFDALICPRHDRLTGPGVIRMLGALHQVDEDTLSQARVRWAERLEPLPAPRVAVLIGASNRAYTIDAAYLEQLAAVAEGWLQASGGSLMVTTSRRTPRALKEFARQRFGRHPGWIWTGQAAAENPYLGFLAWADRIAVSADSVNMISEACGTGKPVYCSPPASGNLKFGRFHQNMRDAGLILPLDYSGAIRPYQPLRETAEVAQQLAQWIERQDSNDP